MDATSVSSPATEAPPTLRVGEWLRVTVLAAIAAGLAVVAFDLTIAEPVVDRAIDAESGGATTAAPELFTRTEQRAGLALAELLFAIGIALVLAGVAIVLNPTRRARTLWLGLAAVCIWALAVLPAIKYPALPPGVESSFEIAERQGAYLALVAAGVLGAAGAVWVWQRAAGRRPADRAALAALVCLLPALVAILLLPGQSVEGSPNGDLLLDFRLVSLAGQLIFWTVVAGAGWVLITRLHGAER